MTSEIKHHTFASGLLLADPAARAWASDAVGYFVERSRTKTIEQQFRDLDVRPGDRIRLEDRRASTSASTLEGVVKKVKLRGGESVVQVEGFDVAGNGVFWPVRDYQFSVLHRAYRWTNRDRLVAELANRADWEKLSDERREAHRSTYGARADRILEFLRAEK